MSNKDELIIHDACIGCGQCVKVCIRGHLSIINGKATEVDSLYYCFRCGHCMAVCPKDAIMLRDFPDFQSEKIDCIPVTPSDIDILLRSRRSIRWFDRKCTKEELEDLFDSIGYSPTAENSQKVQFAVIDESFDDFMTLLASILKDHTDEHPRLKQFVEYVDGGMQEKNNPFTWEGRQLIIAFARFPIDAIIPITQLELSASARGLGGFHSRWMLQAAENDPDAFMSYFPDIDPELKAYAVYVIGHPRIRFKRTVPRDVRKVVWK